MDDKIPRRYRVWLLQAEFDLKAAELSLSTENHEWSCYQSVQAVEKALKAVIINGGWRPPKTHKLGILMGIANKANPNFVSVKLDFRKLEAYTFISRYPFIYPAQGDLTPHQFINSDDSETCLTIAKVILNKIKEFLLTNPSRSQGVLDLNGYYFSDKEVENRVSEVLDLLLHDNELKLTKVVLFGTFAREKERPKTSTMDLLIVADTTLSFIDRMEHVRELTKDNEPIIDPLIYTPEEYSFMLNDEREGFLESAIDEGRVVFER